MGVVAKIIEVIETQERRGHGKEGDPVHLVNQLWTKDGVLLAEFDTYTGKSWFLRDPEKQPWGNPVERELGLKDVLA